MIYIDFKPRVHDFFDTSTLMRASSRQATPSLNVDRYFRISKALERRNSVDTVNHETVCSNVIRFRFSFYALVTRARLACGEINSANGGNVSNRPFHP